ncbi:MAG: hypothetical protein D6812_16160 [Deltaproteobacteria bacterium]|nr:MAG: hypothetical protein D6812_16160 [Deltaproteobacteria bacterium]
MSPPTASRGFSVPRATAADLQETAAGRSQFSRGSSVPRAIVPAGRLLAIVLLLFAGEGWGSSFLLPDSGTKALGRGGAFVVEASDLSAIYYNPAGLTRLSGHHLYLSLGQTFNPVRYVPAGDPEGGVGNRLLLNPNLVGGYAFGGKRVTLALGIFTPSGQGSYRYPDDGAQRYAVKTYTIRHFFVGGAVGWRLSRTLHLGLGVSNSTVLNRYRFDHNPFSTAGEAPGYDMAIDIEVADRFAPAFLIGLRWHPHPLLEVGASFQPGIPMDLSGVQRMEATGESLQAILESAGERTRHTEAVELFMNFPPILRGGVRLLLSPRFDLEMDGVYEGWHVQESLRIVSLDRNEETTIPRNLSDGFSLRIGASAHLGGGWSASAGWFLDTNAIPPEAMIPSFVDGNEIGMSGGIERIRHWGKKSFRIGIAVMGLLPQTIENHASRAPGRYELRFAKVAFSLATHF